MTSTSGIDTTKTTLDSSDRLYDNTTINLSDLAQQESLLLQEHQHEPTTATNADIELYPEQQYRQPSRLAQISQQLTKRKIKAFVYNWRWYLLFAVFLGFFISFIIAHRRQFFEALEILSNKLSDMGYRQVKRELKKKEIMYN